MMNVTNLLKSTAIATVLGLSAAGISSADDQPIDTTGAIDLLAAIEIARSAVPGTVLESEIEDENGLIIWEIEITDSAGSSHEIEINALTSEIISVEVDD